MVSNSKLPKEVILNIFGPCSYMEGQDDHIWQTYEALKDFTDIFRVKNFLGGTTLEKYKHGIEYKGFKLLDKMEIPVAIEVQTPEHIEACKNIDWIWIGARNCENYALREYAAKSGKNLMIKRGANMKIQQVIDMYNVMLNKFHVMPWLIERGISVGDEYQTRWTPDIKIAMVLKRHFPHIFDRFIVDISHSAGSKEYIKDTYEAFKAIGVKNWMAECTIDGKSETDQQHMLSVDELKEIIK